MFELLKSTELIVGLVLTLLTTIMGIFVWLERRQRSYVSDMTGGLEEGHRTIDARLGKVERQMGQIDRDIDQVGDRVRTVEAQMQSLATKTDISLLQVSLARQEERSAATDGKVDTIYRAAMVAATEGSRR